MKLQDPFLAGSYPMPEKPAVQNHVEYHDVPSSDSVRMGEIFSLPASASGYPVNEHSAMRVSTVYACVRLLAGSVSMLPVTVYEEGADGERMQAKNNDIWRFLNAEPNPRWTAAAMWEFLVSSVLLRGDGFAWIDRVTNRYGEKTTGIQGLYPAHPDDVAVTRDGSHLFYQINDNGRMFEVDQGDMLHLPGFGFNGERSMSVIRHGALQAIGIAGSADEYAGSFMQSGGAAKYVLHTDKTISETQRDALKESFARKYSSGDINSPLVLQEGMDVKTISMSATDAQMLESRKFQVEDIARAFGVPPFMVGQTEKTTSWGAGVEQMGRGFLIYTLQPHLTRFEQEINRKLLNSRSNKFVEFLADGIARGDMKARHDAYRQAIGGSTGPGWMTINEVRRKERLPALDGEADKLFNLGGGEQQKESLVNAIQKIYLGVGEVLTTEEAREILNREYDAQLTDDYTGEGHVTSPAGVIEGSAPEDKTNDERPEADTPEADAGQSEQADKITTE